MDVTEMSSKFSRLVKAKNELKVLTEQEKSLSELLKAARAGRYKTIQNMIQNCRNHDLNKLIRVRDSLGNSALHHACVSGSVSTVKLLIEQGCNVKAVNHQENNLLHITVLYGRPVVLKELLKHKDIRVEEKNQAGRTPVMLCAEMGRIDMLNTLRAASASVCQELVGIAASKGCLSFVKYCIGKLGLSLESVDNQGNTVLHHASSQANERMVEFIIKNMDNIGELLLKRNHKGQTAMHCCCDNKNTCNAVLKLLLETAEQFDIVPALMNSSDYYTGINVCVLVTGRDKGQLL
jgi:ankyrin repeat protein